MSDKPKRKVPEGRRFKPGQSGNPNGRPPIPEDVKKARKLNQAEFERVVNDLIGMSVERLEQIAEAKSTPVLHALIARILLKGIDERSRTELNYFVERFLGKVPDQAVVNGNLGLAGFLAARGVKTDKPSDDDDE